MSVKILPANYTTGNGRAAGWLTAQLLALALYTGSQNSDAAEFGDRGTIRVNARLTNISDVDVTAALQLETSADNTNWSNIGSAIDLSSSGSQIGAVTSMGTSPPTVPAITGAPTPGGIFDGLRKVTSNPGGPVFVGGHAVTLSITTAGALNTAQVQLAIDGVNVGSPVLIPSNGIVSLGGGLTATFAAGTYGADNVYSFATSDVQDVRVVIPGIDKFVRTSLAVTGTQFGTVTHTGTGTPATPTLSGAPLAGGPMAGAHTITITIASGHGGALGTAEYTVTIDSGSPSSAVTLPSNGTVVLNGTLTAQFAAGTYVAGDTYAFPLTAVTSPLGSVSHSGTGPSADNVVISGVPAAGGPLVGAHSVVLTVGTGGALGTATVTATIDGGTPSAAIPVPASGIVSLPGGLTATFAAGTYVAADTYTFATFPGPIASVALDVEAV